MNHKAQSKYYDFTNNRPLNLNSDGCNLADWNQLHGDDQFAWHPKGFKIFLPQEKLIANDEYRESDPYTVEQNIDSKFHAGRIELTVELVREAVSLVQSTPQILDLGCGQGHITEKIRQAITNAEVSGLDYSVSAIEYAHEHFPKIDFSVCNAYNSPYSNNFFDVVVCNNLWEHVPDPLSLLGSIKRILKHNGYLIVSTPSRYRIGNLQRILRGQPVGLKSRQHVTEYTVGQVKEQMAYGGFEVRSVLSKPTTAGSIKGRIAKSMFSKLISLIGSHHQLEATVFYLAQEATRTSERSVALE